MSTEQLKAAIRKVNRVLDLLTEQTATLHELKRALLQQLYPELNWKAYNPPLKENPAWLAHQLFLKEEEQTTARES